MPGPLPKSKEALMAMLRGLEAEEEDLLRRFKLLEARCTSGDPCSDRMTSKSDSLLGKEKRRERLRQAGIGGLTPKQLVEELMQ